MKYLSQFVQILLLAVGIFSYQSLFSQTTTFDSSTTYTIPAGVTQIKVEAWGGGGRGGSRTSGSNSYGGGGGGAYASRIINVTPLTTYTVTVGTGSNNNGNPGGDSWFSPNNSVLNALVLAKGGNSVPDNSTIGANGGNYAECIGDIRNNGGRGANGSSAGGGGGASAGRSGIGPSAINEFGAIATTGADGTGGNGQTANGNGSAGSVPGGGGGGARRTSGSPTGGNGANGRIIITILGPQSAITTNTEWVAPAGITAVEVEAWGGGGRGGSRSSNGRGGGGGGGAYSRGLISVNPGQTYYINVGAGSTTTNSGGSSWFNFTNGAPTTDDFVLAVGGESVLNNNNNNGANGGNLANGLGNQEKRSGGNGANSTSDSTGGGGASASRGANGGNASGGIGGIAPLGGGNGANGHDNNNTNGYPGITPGGGGSGARKSSGNGTISGGAGADGQVIIHTFYNVAIQKTVNTTTPLVGSNVTFTITVTNNGTNTARGISVLDQIPTGLTFVSAGTPTHGIFNSGNLTWTIGELQSSAVATLTLTANVNATGNYTNRAILSTNLLNQSSNISAVTIFPQQPTSDLQIIKEVDNSMSLMGDEIVFSLTAYNAGPQNATGVTVQDILPLGFTYVSDSGTYDANTGIWTIGNLNSGASTTLTITATINSTGNHYNQAIILGNQTDPNLSNNSSAIMVYPMYPMTEIVLPCATLNYDLSTFSIGTPPPGAEVSWHTATPADDSNKVLNPTDTQAGRVYYVAFYDPVQNCYGSTSTVKITRSCLITNPMIRQEVR